VSLNAASTERLVREEVAPKRIINFRAQLDTQIVLDAPVLRRPKKEAAHKAQTSARPIGRQCRGDVEANSRPFRSVNKAT